LLVLVARLERATY